MDEDEEKSAENGDVELKLITVVAEVAVVHGPKRTGVEGVLWLVSIKHNRIGAMKLIVLLSATEVLGGDERLGVVDNGDIETGRVQSKAIYPRLQFRLLHSLMVAKTLFPWLGRMS